MRFSRPFLSLLSILLVAVATAASADKNYVFTGRLTSNRGKFINIPVLGNTPCGTLMVSEGPGATMFPPTPAPTTPPTRIPNDANTIIEPPGNGCVKVAGKVVTTGKGAGGAFTFPTMAFTKPLYGLVAVSVPGTPQVIQLATDFKISGPIAARSPYTAMEGPTMATAGNMAPHRVFMTIPAGGTMLTMLQSGRTMDKFTWCPGGAFGCSKVTAAPAATRMIVKYAGGADRFSGTMGYVITAGAGTTASLAIRIPDAFGMYDAAFAILSGMGEQPTGNGYALKLMDDLMSGPLWTKYTIKSTTQHTKVGKQKLIGMVSGVYIMTFFPKATNINYGFPFTVNTVLARNTGKVLGQTMVTTVTATGKDTVTTMGARNLSLVAGGLAHVIQLTSNTPGIAQLELPEPGSTLQLLAGVVGLLGIAGWRARKMR